MSMKNLLKNVCLAGVASLASMGTAWANNVQVALEGSLLKVIGDNLGNDFVISQNIAGDITVTGRNGTTVNGRPSFRLPRVALNAIEMQLEGGNDIVTVRNLQVANDLYANLGEGNDRFDLLAGTNVGVNASVEGGLGADTIRVIDSIVGEDLFVDGGLDALTATVTRATIGKGLTVIGDEAADRVTITDTTMADIGTVETKGGNDRVDVSLVMAFAFAIDTDRGADIVNASDMMTADDVGVFTGTENDRVTLTNVMSGKNLIVSLDAGADAVTVEGVSVTADAVFEGGAGVDTYTDLGITAGIKLDVKEFEVLR